MRLSHCESHCAGPFRLIPCLPQSKDASRDAAAASPPAPRPAAVAEEEPPPVQKVEAPVAAGRDDDAEKREDVEKAPALGKSCLKKTSCGDDECADKGNVKWLDLIGKDLAEIKEYEPRYISSLSESWISIASTRWLNRYHVLLYVSVAYTFR
jgi:hypothetical protein